jgi:hypothetical protein
LGTGIDLFEDAGELERGLRDSAAVHGIHGAQRARDIAGQFPHGQFADVVLLDKGGQLLGVGEAEDFAGVPPVTSYAE